MLATKEIAKLPNNLEAEQALLGSLLLDNENLNLVADLITKEHFYLPLHGDIYAAIAKYAEKGLIATPITLKAHFSELDIKDETGRSIGEYLLEIATANLMLHNIRTYAQIIYDNYIRRKLINIAESAIKDSQEMTDFSNSMERLERVEQELFNLAFQNVSAEQSYVSLEESLKHTLERVSLAKKLGKYISGIPSGMIDLDKLLGGLHQSDLIILAARPSMGKTSLAVSIALNTAEYFLKEQHKSAADDVRETPKSVAFFSLEMSSEQIATRMLAIKSHIDSSRVRIGNVNSDEFSRLSAESSYLAKLPLFIDDTPALSIAALRTRARRLKRKHNVGAIFVDYLQLLRGSNNDHNRVQEIGEISQGLKALAKELDVPVIALSQLSRAVETREDKRPQLSDLRESGNIEQDADVVMFIFREEYYHSRRKPLAEDNENFMEWKKKQERIRNLAEIIIAKQRNGPIGNVTLRFNNATTEFGNFEANSNYEAS